MGMYFVVQKEPGDVCPFCSHPIGEWQSKDDIGLKHDPWGGCCERHPAPLPTLRKEEVENFYEKCRNPECEKWVEYENHAGRFVLKEET